MKRFAVLTALSLFVMPVSSARAAGMIIDSIKAHVQQHSDKVPPRQEDQRKMAQPPQTLLEHWFHFLLDALVR
jgi:hypothetical protein